MSMTPKKKKAVGVAVASAAAAAIGFGVSGAAQADTTTPTPTPASTSTQASGDAAGSSPRGGHGPVGRHGGGGFERGIDPAALATKLGVDQAKLEAALSAVREEMRPADDAKPNRGTKPDPSARADELATKLASKLGIDAAKVKAALAELRTAAAADRTKAFDDRLAQAVKDGTLSPAEADAVKKAAQAGVIGMGGDRGPR